MVDESVKQEPDRDERMKNDLSEAATLLLAIRRVAMHINDNASVEVQAMAEKAGYLVDRNIKPLTGGTCVVGGFDEWIGLQA